MIVQDVFAQKSIIRYEIDTLEQFPNKTLVEYKVFSDSVLEEHTQAFFFPVIKQLPRFRIFSNIFLTDVYADSIVFHGKRITDLYNQYYQTEIFENNKLTSIAYFDSLGQEISMLKFQKHNTRIGPCGTISGRYFFHGKRKKKTRN